MSDGVLSVVATPIGNLADLSPRAAETLRAAQLILCEDTRRTRKLLSHLGVGGSGGGPRLTSSHAHNERERVDEVVEAVAAGYRVALVTDAGTPAVSDPGQAVVDAVLDAGLRVEVIPGPSAVLAALVATGLASDRFCFEGFLPRKGKDRQERLVEIAAERRTVVLFEAPGRVAATLQDLERACGPARAAGIAREITKLHEEVDRGSLDALVARWSEERKGEHVIVVSGAVAAREEPSDDTVRAAMAEGRAGGQSRRDAAGRVAADLGVSKKRAYELGDA
ncbi:MAG TPA: 16S rRNA (cytidine(1402)-2'-O)-methyltransferase [Acidimicrobiales bacterium]|nr:16S rRNA (cytidine(1402)-2'-O)-methyltransferase [Acidimicrobiales bacterium]